MTYTIPPNVIDYGAQAKAVSQTIDKAASNALFRRIAEDATLAESDINNIYFKAAGMRPATRDRAGALESLRKLLRADRLD